MLLKHIVLAVSESISYDKVTGIKGYGWEDVAAVEESEHRGDVLVMTAFSGNELNCDSLFFAPAFHTTVSMVPGREQILVVP